MLPFLQLMGVTSSQLSPFCKVFNTLTKLKEAYVMYCPKTFTYDDAVGNKDEEEVEPEVNDSGEQTKAAFVAAKMKEFADETADDVDDGDADKSNMENDEDDDGGVDAILPIDAESTSAPRGTISWILHWTLAKSYGRQLLIWLSAKTCVKILS